MEIGQCFDPLQWEEVGIGMCLDLFASEMGFGPLSAAYNIIKDRLLNMKNLEPIQRGLRPWQAALQKIGEIILWLRQNRLIAGCGVTLIETGEGIVIHATGTENEQSGNTLPSQSTGTLARIRGQWDNGFSADLYGNGLAEEPTERDVFVFLPEIAYGSEIERDTILLVYPVQTKKYNINAERG